MTFSSNFLHVVTILHVPHLDVLRRQIEIARQQSLRPVNSLSYSMCPRRPAVTAPVDSLSYSTCPRRPAVTAPVDSLSYSMCPRRPAVTAPVDSLSYSKCPYRPAVTAPVDSLCCAVVRTGSEALNTCEIAFSLCTTVVRGGLVKLNHPKHIGHRHKDKFLSSLIFKGTYFLQWWICNDHDSPKTTQSIYMHEAYDITCSFQVYRRVGWNMSLRDVESVPNNYPGGCFEGTPLTAFCMAGVCCVCAALPEVFLITFLLKLCEVCSTNNHRITDCICPYL